MEIINHIHAITQDYLLASMYIIFLLLITALIASFNDIKKIIGKISLRTKVIITVITIIGFLLRFFIPAKQHIILYDEMWYLEAASHIVQFGEFGVYAKSMGWPFLLSILFRITEANNLTAILFTIIIGSLSIILMFLLTYAITKNQLLGIVSAIIFAISPVHIRWSSTTETNIASLFFIMLAMFLFFIYYRSFKTSLLLCSGAAIAVAATFRPENYILFPLFLIGAVIFRKKEKLFPLLGKVAIPLFIAFAITIPNLIQVLDFQTGVDWLEVDSAGKLEGKNWSLNNLVENISFLPKIFSKMIILIPLFFFIGILPMIKHKKRELVFMSFWFLLLAGVYFTSWFQTLTGKERFYMSFYPILFFIAAIGIIASIRKVRKIFPKDHSTTVFILMLVGILILIIPSAQFAKDYSSESDRELATIVPDMAERDIDNSCIIVANWPTLIRATTDFQTVETSYFLNNTDSFENISCLLFYSDITCNSELPFPFIELSAPLCEEMKKLELEKEKSYNLDSIEYTFYRIKVP